METLAAKSSSGKTATASEVKAMYEAFPYPSPTAGDSLIEDVANGLHSIFGGDTLDGRLVLDAGCGTGHRLIAVARRYPRARFVGLDMTSASLDVARALARKHNCTNVAFEQSDLVAFRPAEPFDVIVSAGVVHHLEDPRRGLQALSQLLAENGVLVVWLYHSLGEHQRLLDRELLLTMWERSTGLAGGLQLLQKLGLHLATDQYGSSATQSKREVSQVSIDVDAYLHPIVNAYRLEQAIDLFRDCDSLRWAAINNLNLPSSSKLVDLGEVERGDLRFFCQQIDGIFGSEEVRYRFKQLSPREKLRVLEIKLKPSGFTILGGRGTSYSRLGARIRLNIISF